MLDVVRVLGIQFFKGRVKDVFDFLHINGGLMTVPAGPNLAVLDKDIAYYESLLNSDIVIPDSGFMVLTWNLLSSNKLFKISGLAFINHFIRNLDVVKETGIFLINPTDIDGEINQKFLNERGLSIKKEFMYTAPIYKEDITDKIVLAKIEEQKPHWVMINIGGGVQEKLGLYLKSNLSYYPVILCTGAAIAFKTGRQVNIPVWVDKLYLGWLFRCISNPKLYIQRYLKGFRLFVLIVKYRSKIVI